MKRSLTNRFGRRGFLTVAAVAALLCQSASLSSASTESRAAATVRYLASPDLGGRFTGSEGESRASAYIVKQLKELGAKPLPGTADYLLPFEFTAGLVDGGTQLALDLKDGQRVEFIERSDVAALSLSSNDTTSGQVVFAGYGLVTGAESAFPYNSYEGLDVAGKVVVIFRGIPENLSADKRLALSHRAADLRTKIQVARDLKVAGVIVTDGPAVKGGGQVLPLTYDSAGDSALAAVSVSQATAEVLFKAGGKTPEEVLVWQQRLDGGDPAAGGFELPGVKATLKPKVERSRKTAYNVVGYFPAKSDSPTADEFVGVGAHYDHLGTGESVSNSLARDSEKGKAHLGADDNASGVGGTLAAAEYLAGKELNRPVFFGFWSGEEIGLLGSASFVRSGPVSGKNIAAYINLDMVGRATSNTLTILGVGSSSRWESLLEESNKGISLKLAKNPDPYTPSDSTSFYLHKMPSVHLFTGTHTDYHRPSDTPDKINYPDLDRIARLTGELALGVANSPDRIDYVKVARTGPALGGSSRSRGRVFVGVVPDYSREVKGLLISGSIGGSPAEKAGLKEGDVLKSLSGQKFTTIHEYMNILTVLKPDEEVTLEYERNGKTESTKITPTRRRP